MERNFCLLLTVLLVLSINGTVQFSVEITVGHTAPDSINSAVIFSLFNEINYRK